MVRHDHELQTGARGGSGHGVYRTGSIGLIRVHVNGPRDDGAAWLP
jgi:hypothetical protein